jgi:hypothetical protein
MFRFGFEAQPVADVIWRRVGGIMALNSFYKDAAAFLRQLYM